MKGVKINQQRSIAILYILNFKRSLSYYIYQEGVQIQDKDQKKKLKATHGFRSNNDERVRCRILNLNARLRESRSPDTFSKYFAFTRKQIADVFEFIRRYLAVVVWTRVCALPQIYFPIGGHVMCHGSKLNNTLGRVKFTNSLGKKTT